MPSRLTRDGDGFVIPDPDHLQTLGAEALDRMQAAADDLVECERILAKTGDTVVSDLLRHDGLERLPENEDIHVPAGDVYDPVTHSQYYFHIRHGGDRGVGTASRSGEEIGHFHTFLRQPGMPEGADPLIGAYGAGRDEAWGNLGHLVAVALGETDDRERPGPGVTRLFATNRWVTGEAWYGGDVIARAVDRFEMDIARPSWPANRWVTAVLRLFAPQIAVIIAEREDAVVRLSADGARDLSVVLEDRDHPVLAEMPVAVSRQVAALRSSRRALRRRGRASPAERADRA